MIHTPDQRLRVFVSSTLQELAPERDIARKTITRLHLIPVLFELGASPHPPRELYRAYLSQSQVFIGIYWQGYGWVAPGMQVSGLEDEYILSSGMPRLIYIKTPAAEREPGLTDMLKRIENEGEASYKKFTTLKELGELIASDLALLLSERFEQPVSTSDAGKSFSNLPAEVNTFVGREAELALISTQFKKDDIRLVTLTGAGGVGKTRLAIRAAHTLLDRFPDGAWLVELAPLSDPGLVAQTIAQQFGVSERSSQNILPALTESLTDKHLLLILDNAEHLVQETAYLVDHLLRNSPMLRILATSREPLGVAGETICQVPPLCTPREGATLPFEQLGHFEAVKLFIDRASAVQPNFQLSEQNRAAIIQICNRLDGIPLAIELAAARLRVMSAQEIAARLDDRFRLLVGNRTAASRQQTLGALFEWSYNLLDEDERTLLRRLAIFSGGWTLDAAEQVCQGGNIDQYQILELLSDLVDKSLVIAEVSLDHTRYRFLETIRQFSLERLIQNREQGNLAQRHGLYFANLAEQTCLELSGPQLTEQLKRLDEENDNIRAALEWLDHSDQEAELFLGVAAALAHFWELRGAISEGRKWIEHALEKNPKASAGLLADGLRSAGILASRQADFDQAQSLHEKSLKLFREMNNLTGIANELDELGKIAHDRGNYEEVVDLFNESLALRYEAGDKEGMAYSIGNLGMLAREQGRSQVAEDLLEEGLEISRELEDRLVIAQALKNLGLVAFYSCEYPRAKQLFQEAEAIYRDLNDRSDIAETLQNLGNVAKDQGDFKPAIDYYHECLGIRQELSDRQGIAQATTCLAEVAFYQGNYPQASELAERGYNLFKTLGTRRGIIFSLGIQAFIAHYQGDFEKAHSLAEECLAMAQSIDAPRPIAYSKEIFGLGAYTRGDYPEAIRLFQEAVNIFQKVGDRKNVAVAWVNLARTAYRQENIDAAIHYLNNSLTISHKLEIQWTLSYSLEIMGLLERKLGNIDRAQAFFQESLKLSLKQNNQQGIANCLGALAGIAIQQEQPELAVRLFAHADQIRRSIGAWMGKDDRQEYESFLELVRRQVNPLNFNAAWEAGCRSETGDLVKALLARAEDTVLESRPGEDVPARISQ